MSEFKPGDVVVLKSGSARMTVEHVGPYNGRDFVDVVWWHNDSISHDRFAAAALKLYQAGD